MGPSSLMGFQSWLEAGPARRVVLTAGDPAAVPEPGLRRSAPAVLPQPRHRVVGREDAVRVDGAADPGQLGPRRVGVRRAGVDRALGEVQVRAGRWRTAPAPRSAGRRPRGPGRPVSGVAAIATREGDELGVEVREHPGRPRAGGPARRRAGAARRASSEVCGVRDRPRARKASTAASGSEPSMALSETNGRAALGVHVQADQRLGRHPGEGVDLRAQRPQPGEQLRAALVGVRARRRRRRTSWRPRRKSGQLGHRREPHARGTRW